MLRLLRTHTAVQNVLPCWPNSDDSLRCFHAALLLLPLRRLRTRDHRMLLLPRHRVGLSYTKKASSLQPTYLETP